MSDVEKVARAIARRIAKREYGEQYEGYESTHKEAADDYARTALSAARPDEWNAAIEVAKQVTHDQRTRWEEECKKATGKSIVNAARYADMAFACGEVAKQINNLRRPAGEEG